MSRSPASYRPESTLSSFGNGMRMGVKDLTLAQVKALDCGSQTLPDFPQQEAVPGAQIPTLREVFDLVERYRSPVHLTVETNVEAGAPQETAPREEFVQQAVKEIRAAGFLNRVTIESFDWGSLMRMKQVEPRLPLVALITPEFAQVGQPGKSPWLGWLDVHDFGDDEQADRRRHHHRRPADPDRRCQAKRAALRAAALATVRALGPNAWR
jgi:glycerophosphoryl diester phosphodiesterase